MFLFLIEEIDEDLWIDFLIFDVWVLFLLWCLMIISWFVDLFVLLFLVLKNLLIVEVDDLMFVFG